MMIFIIRWMSVIYSFLDQLLQYSTWIKLVAVLKKVVSPSFHQEGGYFSKVLSVNYHFTRQCNYECGFCFHTAKTSFVMPLEEAKEGLRLLKEEGKYLDILAISCDSFNEDTNKAIGRGQGTRNHIESLMKIRQWCSRYRVAFKVNTVINTYNIDEDMIDHIMHLNPIRWKVFQCLLLEGENAGPDALRNAERFYVTDKQFADFLDRHRGVPTLVAEDNVKMQNSYLILDEYMRFLDCREGAKKPSPSILDVGVAAALDHSGFDEAMFRRRGGVYRWSKADMDLQW
ncbi:S-adenosylmethionine-dependent nucleotide dehydratase RSAD2-like isoform X2 [Bacillus rossius redtenbacheri]|uniref:S-adenosylmethionine-dependent nucleotide dehydratase RSAD2-like isoform X2 n=1 Tax=Bacillus rossius redtenbacheri TaxID=93214 RepID=UPI002FDD7628